MTAPCRQQELTRWAQGGLAAPLDRAFVQHLADCADCADEHASIVEVRSRLNALPVRNIPTERLDAMRFQLLAAARGSAAARNTPPASAVRSRRRWPMAIAAGAAVLAAAAAFLLVWPSVSGRSTGETTAEVSPTQPPVAEIHLADDANGVRAHDGPDEIYALLRGKAQFQVRPLREGERFRVVAGGDTVEVRGTRFAVLVEQGRVAAVEVEEGAVLVTLAEGESYALAAGESWQRAPLAAPSSTEDTPLATAEGRDNRAGSPPEVGSAAGVPAAASEAPRATAPSATASAAKSAASPPASDPRRGEQRAAFDARFQRALQLLKSGSAAEAARLFDELGQDASADNGRREDALYWSARAHAQAGHHADAEQRAKALAGAHPGSWHAEDAALLVGESLLERGDVAGARPWLERAARSPRESIRTRAERALGGAARQPNPQQ